MTKVMSDIRFYYHKQIKKLKEQAKMKDRTPQVDDDPFADARKERSMIKAGMIAQSYGDYHKGIVSDLNAVLDSATYYVNSHAGVYDANELKALQDSINNIQEYKNKLINQYIK